MSYLGIDHGTSAVRFWLMPENLHFEIPREKKSTSALKEISKRVKTQAIELAGVTYSMGDGISQITRAEKVHSRGVLEESTGDYVGTGTGVYDEVVENIPSVVIPGLHRGLDVLDERFRALYSHMASAEKVSIAYEAYSITEAGNFIVSDIGSNTVTLAIKDSRLLGGFDACLGAMGLEHGALDLEAIRRIDRGLSTANQAFYSSGAKKIYAFKDSNEILEPKNRKARLAFEALVLSAKMEICSLLCELDPEAIVLTGRAGAERVFSSLEASLRGIAPVIKMDRWSAARGSARIARDVDRGKREVLGIGVEL